MNDLSLKQLFVAAIQPGEYVGASGQKLPWFLDAQNVVLEEPGFSLVGRELADLVRLHRIDAIGGPATGAIAPICAALAQCCWLHGLYVKDDKVSGTLHSGDRLMMVDDVVTTGNTLARAIDRVPLNCVLTVALVQRGSAAALKKMDMPLFEAIVKL